MSKENNLFLKPSFVPLIIILIGTTILAIPAALGTYSLFDQTGGVGSMEEPLRTILFWISIGGFILFAGYILTAIFQRHYFLFWLFSFIYNLSLSGCYLFILFWQLSSSTESPVFILYFFFTSGAFLLPAWTIFVTIASFYYFKHGLFPKKLNLP